MPRSSAIRCWRRFCPTGRAIWRGVANPRVQHAGTIGGSGIGGDAALRRRPGAAGAGRCALTADSLERIRIPVAPSPKAAGRSFAASIISLYLGAGLESGKIRSHPGSPSAAAAQPATANCRWPAFPWRRLAPTPRRSPTKRPPPLPSRSATVSPAAYRRRMIEVLTRRLCIKLRSQP